MGPSITISLTRMCAQPGLCAQSPVVSPASGRHPGAGAVKERPNGARTTVGKGLSLSTAVVFLSFFVWSRLLGGPGALPAVFLTVLVLLLLDSYDETRWLAGILTPERSDSTPAAGR